MTRALEGTGYYENYPAYYDLIDDGAHGVQGALCFKSNVTPVDEMACADRLPGAPLRELLLADGRRFRFRVTSNPTRRIDFATSGRPHTDHTVQVAGHIDLAVCLTPDRSSAHGGSEPRVARAVR